MERLPVEHQRLKRVIFTSRWDREKCPDFFLAVIEYILDKMGRTDILFLHTTSAENVRSNDSKLLADLHLAKKKFEPYFRVKTGLTKEEYYSNLLGSKVQFNCADQDFVSWTLLEATTCGCIPVYPYYLSFPEALDYQHQFMYVKGDVKDAARKIIYWIDEPLDMELTWIYKRFDKSWERMLNVMKETASYPIFLERHTRKKRTK
jgi:hypothetical protein